MTTDQDKQLLESIGLTAEEADRRGKELESDTWSVEAFGAARRGRPSIANEDVKPYTVRFPVSLMGYVDERADANGRSRSEELRAIVAESKARDEAA